jgi:sugar lactone lactonase YvrE
MMALKVKITMSAIDKREARRMTTNARLRKGTKLIRFTMVFIFILALLLLQPSAALAEYGTGDGQFQYPKDVAVDSSGNVYVADTSNCRIQKYDSEGNFLTKWGSYGSGDGEFYFPVSIAVYSSDEESYVYVADNNNKRIQKFDSEGNFLTKWGSVGTGQGQFLNPKGVAVDSSGNVCVVDTYNYISGEWIWPDYHIQKFDSSGDFITGWGPKGISNGEFMYPTSITVDPLGNVYATDFSEWPNQRIQKFDSEGNFLTKWGSYGSGDGEFSYPQGIAVYSSDEESYVYVCDTANNRVHKFDSDGQWLDTWGSEGTGAGYFSYPEGIAVDSSGNIYVADTGNHRIQKLNSAGEFVDCIPPLNQPPIADAGPDQTGIVGEEITLDGSNSYDIDGTIVSYEWDFGDGDTGNGNIITHLYSTGGTYEVTLTVSDDDEAVDTDTKTVYVQTPEEAIQDLISDVEELGLTTGVENSLISKLKNAIKSLAKDQKTAAINQLCAFINEVEAQRGKEITSTQADDLIAKAQRVVDNI